MLREFSKADVHAKPMLRWWLPDAGAEPQRLRAQMVEMYSHGFGGVEVAMVPQFTQFDPAEYGWGSERWRTIMKTILQTAKTFPDGFKVDFTITAHWPPALNTITPNDPAASHELNFVWKKLPQAGVIDLPMPKPKTNDKEPQEPADFIFRDDLVSVSLARVAAVDGGIVTLSSGSVVDITSQAQHIIDETTGQPKFTPAGIPEHETQFDTRPIKPQKLADKQHYWQVDLTDKALGASDGEELRPGDHILIASYMRGTGQSTSGRATRSFQLWNTMPGRVYTTDYFCAEGTDAITSFWEHELFSDPELKKLLEESGGTIFEDSIECSADGSFWTCHLIEEFKARMGYDLLPYMPYLVGFRVAGPGSAPGGITFVSEDGIETKVREDYKDCMGKLYIGQHIERLQEYYHKHGLKYRAQAYGFDEASDTNACALHLDIAEDETMGQTTGFDGMRAVTGGVHLAGKTFHSSEAMAAPLATYARPWKEFLQTYNLIFAAGINRVVFHGSSYQMDVNRKHSTWPGWHAFQHCFGDPWNERQIYWSDVDIFTGYLTRTQFMLQYGKAKPDFVVYRGFMQSGPGGAETLGCLLDMGYCYDIYGNSCITYPGLKAENGILDPGGADYRCMIIDNSAPTPVAVYQRLAELAEADLPMIVLGAWPQRTRGLSGEDNTDEALAELTAKLDSLPNAYHAATPQDIAPILSSLGIHPYASAQAPGLLTLRRSGDEADCYYILNSGSEALDTTICLSGRTNPFTLDAWTGSVTPCPVFKNTDRGVEVPLRLQPGQSTIIALVDSPEVYHAISCDTMAQGFGQDMTLKCPAAGTYTASFSDGETKSVTVQAPPEAPDLEWTLSLESWGPGDDPENPFVSKKTFLHVGKTPLMKWEDLDVSASDLQRLGVSRMYDVSGIGLYTSTLLLDDSWSSAGAWLKLEHQEDMITGIWVNGTKLGAVDQSAEIFGLGDLLRPGLNTIQVKLTTTMVKRVNTENNDFYEGKPMADPSDMAHLPDSDAPAAGGPGPEEAGGPPPGGNPFGGKTVRDYGLTAAQLIPYTIAKF